MSEKEKQNLRKWLRKKKLPDPVIDFDFELMKMNIDAQRYIFSNESIPLPTNSVTPPSHWGNWENGIRKYRQYFKRKHFGFKPRQLKPIIKGDNARNTFVDTVTKFSNAPHILLNERTKPLKPLLFNLVYLSDPVQTILKLGEYMEEAKHYLSTDKVRKELNNVSDGPDCIKRMIRKFAEQIRYDEDIEKVTAIWQADQKKGYIFALEKDHTIFKYSTLCWIYNTIGDIIPDSILPNGLASTTKKVVIISSHCHSANKIEKYLHSNGCVRKICKATFLRKTLHLFENKNPLSDVINQRFEQLYQSYPDSGSVQDNNDYESIDKDSDNDDLERENDDSSDEDEFQVRQEESHTNDHSEQANDTESSFPQQEIVIRAKCEEKSDEKEDAKQNDGHESQLKEEELQTNDNNGQSDDSYPDVDITNQVDQVKPQLREEKSQINDIALNDDSKEDYDIAHKVETDEIKEDTKQNDDEHEINVICCLKELFGAQFLVLDKILNESSNIGYKFTKPKEKIMTKMHNGRGASNNVRCDPSQTEALQLCIMEETAFTSSEQVYYNFNYMLKLQVLVKHAREYTLANGGTFYVFNTGLHDKNTNREVHAVLVANTYLQKKEKNWELKVLGFCIGNEDKLPENAKKAKKYIDRIKLPNVSSMQILKEQLQHMHDTDFAKLNQECEYWRLMLRKEKKTRKIIWKKATMKFIWNCELIKQIFGSNNHVISWMRVLIFKKNKFWIDRVLLCKLVTEDGTTLLVGIRYHFDTNSKRKNKWIVKSISTNIGDLMNKSRLVDAMQFARMDPELLKQLNKPEWIEKQKNVKLQIKYKHVHEVVKSEKQTRKKPPIRGDCGYLHSSAEMNCFSRNNNNDNIGYYDAYAYDNDRNEVVQKHRRENSLTFVKPSNMNAVFKKGGNQIVIGHYKIWMVDNYSQTVCVDIERPSVKKYVVSMSAPTQMKDRDCVYDRDNGNWVGFYCKQPDKVYVCLDYLNDGEVYYFYM